MARFLVRSPQFRPLTDGDATSLGTIEISQEGSEWSVIDIDDDTETAVEKLQNAQDNGIIDEFTPENILYPQGIIHNPEPPRKRFGILGARQIENRMGLDFHTWGITHLWQDIISKKSMILIGVADTGRVPEAARQAHMPHVELIHVHGGDDRHGHQTACVSRIVGILGVLNTYTQLVTAQALPRQGGGGTTTEIVNAIRALRDYRGTNGKRLSVISLSLGMDGRDPIIDREIMDTQAAGVMCVAAMGNSGWNIRNTGTPAAVCLFAAGATVFEGNAPAVFSTGGCQLPEETGAGPGQNVGLAHLDGGYGSGDGTSFSCPVLAAIVAGALSAGWTPSQIREYLQSHQRPFIPPRRVGLIQLNASDFGKEEEPFVNVEEIVWRAQEVDARIEVAQQARQAIQNGTMSWDTLYNTELGPIRDLMREVIAIAKVGQAPGGEQPPVEPTPLPLVDPRQYMKGWSAPQHWQGSQEGKYAIDWYAAPIGTDCGWIVGGRTRGVAVMGPLFLPKDGHDCALVSGMAGFYNTADGRKILVQWSDDDVRELPDDHIFLPSGTALYTVILDSDDGETMFAFTHVLREARLDVQVKKDERFFKIGDSGLETFTQRGQNPAHIHLAIMRDRNQFGRWQGGMGNVEAWSWLLNNGFSIRNMGVVPSPQHYLSGYKNTNPY